MEIHVDDKDWVLAMGDDHENPMWLKVKGFQNLRFREADTRSTCYRFTLLFSRLFCYRYHLDFRGLYMRTLIEFFAS